MYSYYKNGFKCCNWLLMFCLTSLSLHQVPGQCISTQENTGAPQWFSWKSCTSIVGFNFSGFLWILCLARTSVSWRITSQMWLVHKTVKIWLVISVNSLNRDYFVLSEKCTGFLLYNRVHCGVVTARILEFALNIAPQMRNYHHLNM
jgi:hypothetical protein